MNAFFMAKGPLIARGNELKAINSVDLYNLFCRILRIEGICGANDGSMNADIWTELFAKKATTTTIDKCLLLRCKNKTLTHV